MNRANHLLGDYVYVKDIPATSRKEKEHLEDGAKRTWTSLPSVTYDCIGSTDVWYQISCSLINKVGGGVVIMDLVPVYYIDMHH